MKQGRSRGTSGGDAGIRDTRGMVLPARHLLCAKDLADGRALGWGSLYSFKQGRVDPGQVLFNPASRQFDPSYPGANVTAATLKVPASVVKLGLPTYMELGFSINNRNGNVVQSLYSFQ